MRRVGLKDTKLRGLTLAEVAWEGGGTFLPSLMGSPHAGLEGPG